MRPGGRLRQLAQQFADFDLDQRGRTQFQQQCAHLSQCAAGQLAQFLQATLALVLAALPKFGQDFRNERRRKERLGHRIVQIAGDTIALGGHGCPFDLGAQPGVFDGQGRLIADGQRQFDLLRREFARFTVVEHQAAVTGILDQQRNGKKRLIAGFQQCLAGRIPAGTLDCLDEGATLPAN